VFALGVYGIENVRRIAQLQLLQYYVFVYVQDHFSIV